MPVHKLNCTADQSSQNIPSNLKIISVSELNIDSKSCTDVIKGKIRIRWPLQKRKSSQHFKFVLEDVSNSSVNVFVFGAIADDLNFCKENDILILSDYHLAKNCHTATSPHKYHIEIDTSSTVWVVDSGGSTTATAVSVPHGGSQLTKSKYTYTLLKDLKMNTTVDVYAVIKFMKPVRKSRGTDYMIFLSLIDPSLTDSKIKCLLFANSASRLPPAEVGNVIRLHRLKITKYNDEFQGQNGPGFSWLLFKSPDRSESNPVSSSAIFTYTDSDQKKVEELFAWFNSRDNLSQPTSCTLAGVKPQLYFDFVCQVVSTSVIEEKVCFLLQVWDGTRNVYPVRQMDVDADKSKTQTSETLMKKADGFIVDVCLYEDHFVAGETINPGDFIKLFNLHAAEYKKVQIIDDSPSLPTIELCLHRGTSFGRGVIKLNSSSDEVKTLSERLDAVGAEPEPMEIEKENDNNERQHSQNEAYISDLNTNSPNEVCVSLPCTSSENRCMQETETVITGHHHIKRTKIGDVLQHDVPYKFRIQAKVLKIQPDSPTDFIKLFCPHCKHLCSPVDIQNADKPAAHQTPIESNSDNRTFMELMENLPSSESQTSSPPSCPKCSKHQDSSLFLEYTYMMQLLLNDGTGSLTANLWRQNAVTFFKDIRPEDVVNNLSNQAEITQLLSQLSPSDKTHPWLECCVCSYTGHSGVCYQIFDTTVA